MYFNTIVGNPPYQLRDGSENRSSAKAIYPYFVEYTKLLNPKYLCFIIPSKWFVGGKFPPELRKEWLEDKHIKELHDFIHSSLCFKNIDLAGGVNYFLRNSNYLGPCLIYTVYSKNTVVESIRYLKEKELNVFIRHSYGLNIVKKIKNINIENRWFDTKISTRNPFCLSSNFKTFNPLGDIKIYHAKGYSYISDIQVTKNRNYIGQHKVYISYANGNAIRKEPYSVISKPFYGEPYSVCTDTYLMICVDSKDKADNILSYIKTKLFRFLLYLQKSTPTADRKTYSLIPLLDFSKQWTDKELYENYGLLQEEIDFIESMIKPMA